MAFSLDGLIVFGISASALFDLSFENQIFETEGIQAFVDYQIKHEKDILKPGPGFKIVQALLNLNKSEERKIEIIILSKNNTEASLRIYNSIEYYDIDIHRSVFTSGDKLETYCNALNIDLFLSTYEKDVKNAINAKIASALVFDCQDDIHELRIAFSGDSVLLSNDSLHDGPLKTFLNMLKILQKEFLDKKLSTRTALLTSISQITPEYMIQTFKSLNITIDKIYLLKNTEKEEIFKSFGAHLFFNDYYIKKNLFVTKY